MDLKELGITQDELVERLVAKVASELLGEEYGGYDEDGDPVGGRRDTEFLRKARELIRERINESVAAVAERHIFPRIDDLIANLVLQTTNSWGEKRGEPVTFIEYMTQRAEVYLSEKVNYQGKSKAEADGYSWSGKQTRLTYMVHERLSHEIELAMKKSMTLATKTLGDNLAKTAKLCLAEIADKLTVQVRTQ